MLKSNNDKGIFTLTLPPCMFGSCLARIVVNWYGESDRRPSNLAPK